MPLQNRVQPDGDILAIAQRGTLTGNRGIIHGPDRELGTARWSHKAWICCTLDWQGRKREVMTGRKWTELFFLDEAVAFAAGHRPCGYCRRHNYQAFKDAWEHAYGPAGAKEMDAILHKARVKPNRKKVTYFADARTQPNGCFVRIDGTTFLKDKDSLLRFSVQGYDQRTSIPNEEVEVLTPKPLVGVLERGYLPILHPSARKI